MVDTFRVDPKKNAVYIASVFRDTLGRLFSDGIFADELNGFEIDNTLGGLNFKVKPGRALIDGVFVELSSASDTKTMPASSTRQIFISLTLDGSSPANPTGSQIEILNGTTPSTPYIQVAELISDGSSITTVRQNMSSSPLPVFFGQYDSFPVSGSVGIFFNRRYGIFYRALQIAKTTMHTYSQLGLNTIIRYDEFSQYTDQTVFDAAYPSSDTTKMRGNPSTDKLDFHAAASDSTNDSLAFDFGAGVVSDTEWVLRFRLRFSSLSNDQFMHIGMSSHNHNTGSGSVQDWIGMYIYKQTSSSYHAKDTDGAAPNATGGDASQSIAWATGTDYFFEIVRESATSYKIKRYSDQTYKTVLETVSGTCASTVQALRYFKIMNDNRSAGGAIVGTISSIEFYNEVSVVG